MEGRWPWGEGGPCASPGDLPTSARAVGPPNRLATLTLLTPACACPSSRLPPLQRQVEVNVRNKILYLIQAWAHAFRNEPKYKVVQDTYQIMKVEGESAGTVPASGDLRAVFILGGRGQHPPKPAVAHGAGIPKVMHGSAQLQAREPLPFQTSAPLGPGWGQAAHTGREACGDRC